MITSGLSKFVAHDNIWFDNSYKLTKFWGVFLSFFFWGVFLSFFLSFFHLDYVGVLALTSLMVLFTSASFQDFQTRQLLTLCISSFLKNN